VSQTPYPKQLNKADFVDAFGSIYEHSTWVAEAVYPSMTPGIDAQSMAEAMRLVVEEASDVLKLELLRAHPDLAGRLSLAELTESSRSEQTGAGLDQCTPAELAEFQDLNNAYLEIWVSIYICRKGFSSDRYFGGVPRQSASLARRRI